ncbi:unnamed protein product [Arctia plantaginis]|uniref:Uncharacterized protein n=1 Tax=Arctia plantaginis TaxID=874455 RepID=A0A8S1ABV9_ARCPL|nr:unnamed protein product [Arctia plantaginis]
MKSVTERRQQRPYVRYVGQDVRGAGARSQGRRGMTRGTLDVKHARRTGALISRAAAGSASAAPAARCRSTPPPSYPRLPAHAHSTYSQHHTPQLPNSEIESLISFTISRAARIALERHYHGRGN